MSQQPILSTRPPSRESVVLQEKFYESVVAQSTLMDKLGQQLLTLELAVPGLYATVLQLTQGPDATLPLHRWLISATFGFWLLALAATMVSLIPQKYKVDPTLVRQSSPSDVLGLEAFFYRSARYKYSWLIVSCICFWVGIGFAVVLIL